MEGYSILNGKLIQPPFYFEPFSVRVFSSQLEREHLFQGHQHNCYESFSNLQYQGLSPDIFISWSPAHILWNF